MKTTAGGNTTEDRIGAQDGVFFRAMEPEDLTTVFEMENRREAFVSGETRMPFSYAYLREYIEKSLKENFLESGQLRLMVCSVHDRGTASGARLGGCASGAQSRTDIGILDFFNYDTFCARAELGVIVLPPYRSQGYGRQILHLACEYARNTLHLHQLYAEVLATNSASITVFERGGFVRCALKHDWFFSDGRYTDVLGYQKIF